MEMKFGLYQVNSAKERALRDAGEVYAEIVRKRDVPAELEAKYASQAW